MSTIIRSLPSDFQQGLQNPKKLTKSFMGALAAENLVFDTSKTFASVERFDTKMATGNNRLTFFDGQSAFPFVSNVQGSVKPNSEHDCYYACRISYSEIDIMSDSGFFIPGLPQNPEIHRGLINLSVNGVVMLSNVPLTEIFGVNEDISEIVTGVYTFPVPIWWPGQTSVRCELTFPAAVTGEIKTELRFTFIGVGLIS